MPVIFSVALKSARQSYHSNRNFGAGVHSPTVRGPQSARCTFSCAFPVTPHLVPPLKVPATIISKRMPVFFLYRSMGTTGQSSMRRPYRALLRPSSRRSGRLSNTLLQPSTVFTPTMEGSVGCGRASCISGCTAWHEFTVTPLLHCTSGVVQVKLAANNVVRHVAGRIRLRMHSGHRVFQGQRYGQWRRPNRMAK
ncbi:hypothetical protein DAEQUDRAFT_581875 [Daedalea quercina L-15889]|uniref:Uncharacterized protein n=1 Tax=Daedalea quercina L-15889 TaxID=1314783 RepID=A0A165LR97_9APHY|nr:hypothetical protein DAEQUDRAFT_581875 [Daedalea quercina L-15889]